MDGWFIKSKNEGIELDQAEDLKNVMVTSSGQNVTLHVSVPADHSSCGSRSGFFTAKSVRACLQC